jgi:cytochrome c biogenesis protein CcmG/thiol:disulfide interchange protein DsbE
LIAPYAEIEDRVNASTKRRPALVFLLPLALLGVLAYGVLGHTLTDEPRLEPAPAFSLDVLELGTPSDRVQPLIERAGRDGRITLDELRGTPVVLNFWASWCEYCRNETPMLETRWKRAAADGVLVLGVDVDDDSGDARDFLSEYGVTYPTVSDAGDATADRYRATGLPATYFIDAHGDLVDQFIGELGADDLEAGIRAAQTGRPAS